MTVSSGSRFPDQRSSIDHAHSVSGHVRAPGEPMLEPAHDAGPWRGPTESLWLQRILAGALPPRSSGGPAEKRAAHG
jgi:hypothetical protein